jgi:4-carboxymuconolactone decarboxylase
MSDHARRLSRLTITGLSAVAFGLSAGVDVSHARGQDMSSGRDSLTISRHGARSVQPGPAAQFTGTVRVEMLFAPTDTTRAGGALVTFEPGARSAWHSHPRGQTLIVTAGTGRIQRRGGAVEEIRAGDVISTPPGVEHWHGAAPSTAMSHMAIQETLNGTNVRWGVRVTDEEYAAPLRRAAAAAAPTAPGSYADIAPALDDYTRRVLYGDVWERPGLSKRDRSLVTVASLVAQGRQNELPTHLRLAQQNGVTRDELIEAITHLAFYSGWPAANTAIVVARQVFGLPPR